MKTKKKGPHRKLKSFSLKSHEDQNKSPKIIQRSNADHSQIIGGDAVKLLGECTPHPFWFWHPWVQILRIIIHRTVFLRFNFSIFFVRTSDFWVEALCS